MVTLRHWPLRCTTNAHFRKERCTFSDGDLLTLGNKLWRKGLLVFILLTIVLTMGLVGVNIGAPYKAIDFIKESNNVAAALNVIFERIIVRLSPKNARIAFDLRLA